MDNARPSATSPMPRLNLVLLVLALLGFSVLHYMSRDSSSVTIPYSELQRLLQDKQVVDAEIDGDRISGTLKKPKDGKSRFVTTRVDLALAEKLDAAGVRYSQQPSSSLFPLLVSWVLPLLLVVVFWRFAISKMSRSVGPGGMLAIGKSKAKVYVETDTKVTFKDVAGVDEAKQELQEVVAFLKDPKAYGRLGARMPKGVLLVGPPGTGKTLLARAVAGESGVPFFSISGSEFVEMFVGVGAARVRDLFEQARLKAPSIIFIDELDALGRARNASPYFGGHDEKEQTLNQLLVELDGFDSSAGLVLLAATNRPEMLDTALLRAGRFDRQVLVDRPDKTGRVDILRVHAHKIRLAEGVSLESVAALTPGFTGADLANLVNEAALGATRRDARDVTLDDFTVAIERIVAGLEKKNRLLNPLERRIVAHHEAGHALVASALSTDVVQKVSIIPRGISALGYTMQRPTEDRYLMTRAELDSKLAVLLAGRAAEAIIFGHLSTGAADDLAKTTEIARAMATRYAMVPGLGHVAYEAEPSSMLGGMPGPFSRRTYSEITAREIDSAVKDIIDRAFDRARVILTHHREQLERAAALLLERETLTESDLRQLFESIRTPLGAEDGAPQEDFVLEPDKEENHDRPEDPSERSTRARPQDVGGRA